MVEVPQLSAVQLGVEAPGRTLLRGVDLQIPERQVTAVIGPSGAGKSTFLRCLNRLIDLSTNLQVTGTVLFRGASIYDRRVDPDQLRSRIGMLFQQPVVFPRSIRDNVLFGLRHQRRLSKQQRAECLEKALRSAALWHEVADRLSEPATLLSVGQQQRLCLARALALEPEVLLMDEPTSALDPRATELIEQLITQLKEQHTVVMVTHDLSQARRLADQVACICSRDQAGEVVEVACCDSLFTNPQCQETVDFLERSTVETNWLFLPRQLRIHAILGRPTNPVSLK